MLISRSKRSAPILGVLILVASAVWAQEQSYADLSLEQLLDVVITSASKRSESIYEAPSVMEVITADDIRRLGANNLRDVLDRATSIQMIGSSFNPENVVAMRGQSLQHESNHVLMLINGRPYRESTAQGFVAALLAGFPLDLIDSIEIIRGPGSVLYGSSAFSGVINIKTKSVENLEQGSLSASYGSFSTLKLEGHVAKGSKDGSVLVGAKYLDSDGWDFSFTDQIGGSDTFKTGDEDLGVSLVANYKNLTINGFYGSTQQLALQPSGLYPSRSLHHQNTMFDLGYSHSVAGGWTARYNVTYNDFDMGDTRISSEDLLGEVTMEGSVGEKFRLLFGTTYEDHNVLFEENELALQAYKEDSKQLYSLYAQADYKASDWLKLVAGFQYNKPLDLSSDVSPRFGIIGNFETGWGFKLLYGEAFRSATFVERSIPAPDIIIGNPNLLPELIETSEAQVFLRRSKYNLALTYYHSTMTDLIKRVGFPIEFVNSGEIVFDGVELEGKALLGRGVTLAGNAAYQTNEDETGAEDSTFTPNLMAKLGITYDKGSGFALGIYDSYFGEPSQVREFFPGVPEVNAEATAYHLVTLNALLDFDELRDKQGGASWAIQVFVDNLLDEEIHYPDINSQHVNSVPIRPGRGVYATVRVGF